MITVTFRTEQGMLNMMGALEFSKGLIESIDTNKLPSSSMRDLINSIRDVTPYVLAEKAILIKYTEVAFLISNAKWILTSRIKDHEKGTDILKEEHLKIFDNSIKLFTNFLEIIDKKDKDQNYKKIGNRNYNSELEDKYKGLLNSQFKISFDYSVSEEFNGLFVPKKDQVWKLIAYKEGDPTKDETQYDSLIIMEKLTQTKFEIHVDDFEAIAFSI